MEENLMPRETLLGRYLYGFGHVYGVLSVDEAVTALAHYGENTDRGELIKILRGGSGTDLEMPTYDEKNDRFYDRKIDYILKDIPDFCEDILSSRETVDIFYAPADEILAYGGDVPFSPTPAWNEFLDFCMSKKFLNRCTAVELVEHCTSYFLFIQLNGADFDDMTRPPEWFAENFVRIKNEGARSRIQVLAMRMYYYTRLWRAFGRTLGDCFDMTLADNPDDEAVRSSIEEFRAVFKEAEAGIPEPVVSIKIPRNAPCPCGSGKKYKNCCGRENS